MFSSMKNVTLAPENIEKPDEAGDSSSFSWLPDEILLQILSRLIDLKTLCLCKLVSIRFNQIAHQVDVISLTAPSELGEIAQNVKRDSFLSAIKSLKTFRGLKSLCIEMYPYLKAVDSHYLFKWNIKFGNRSDLYVFLSPNSICDMKNVPDKEKEEDDKEEKGEEEDGGGEGEEEEDMELSKKKCLVAIDYLKDAYSRRLMMLGLINYFPLLENCTIIDTCKRGRVSLSGGKNSELRDCLRSHETKLERMKKEDLDNRLRWCYVPFLELPVSGYVMKGVNIVLFEMDELPDNGEDDDIFNINLNGFDDKEDAAYNEAVMEIFKKHRGRVVRLQ